MGLWQELTQVQRLALMHTKSFPLWDSSRRWHQLNGLPQYTLTSKAHLHRSCSCSSSPAKSAGSYGILALLLPEFNSTLHCPCPCSSSPAKSTAFYSILAYLRFYCLNPTAHFHRSCSCSSSPAKSAGTPEAFGFSSFTRRM